MFVGLIIFILGLLIGSFLNVVICRLPQKESLVLPRSHCPHCGHGLSVLELIPVVSFIFLRGRCRYCGERISWQYPLVEMVTGLIFLSFYYLDGLNIHFIIHLILSGLLLPIAIIDFQHQLIPNKITFFGISLGLILAPFGGHLTFSSALLGVLIPGGFLLLLTLLSKGGMGMGDVKLAAMIGTFLGPVDTLLSIFIGAFLGMVYGIIILFKSKKGERIRVPFGTFIAIATLLILYWGEELLGWYLNFF